MLNKIMQWLTKLYKDSGILNLEGKASSQPTCCKCKQVFPENELIWRKGNSYCKSCNKADWMQMVIWGVIIWALLIIVPLFLYRTYGIKLW